MVKIRITAFGTVESRSRPIARSVSAHETANERTVTPAHKLCRRRRHRDNRLRVLDRHRREAVVRCVRRLDLQTDWPISPLCRKGNRDRFRHTLLTLALGAEPERKLGSSRQPPRLALGRCRVRGRVRREQDDAQVDVVDLGQKDGDAGLLAGLRRGERHVDAKLEQRVGLPPPDEREPALAAELGRLVPGQRDTREVIATRHDFQAVRRDRLQHSELAIALLLISYLARSRKCSGAEGSRICTFISITSRTEAS